MVGGHEVHRFVLRVLIVKEDGFQGMVVIVVSLM